MREFYNKINIEANIFNDHKFHKGGVDLQRVDLRVAWFIRRICILRTNLSVLGWAYHSDKTPMSPTDCTRSINGLPPEEFDTQTKELIDCGILEVDKNGAWGVGEEKFMKWQDSVKRANYQKEYREAHNKETSPMRKPIK